MAEVIALRDASRIIAQRRSEALRTKAIDELQFQQQVTLRVLRRLEEELRALQSERSAAIMVN